MGVIAGADRYFPTDLVKVLADKTGVRGLGFIVAAIVCVVFLAADLGLDFGASALNRSSAKYQEIKDTLEKLVKESEGMQNQAVASVNKLKEKKNNVSESKKDSQKSGKGGSRKSEGKKRSKVKGKEVGNSAKNEVLN